MNKGSRNLTSILSAALLMGWGSASVKAEIWADDDSFLDDLPVVVTVTRLPQNVRELPAAVTVIDREMIQASGVVELTDLFRLVPGFQVGHYHGAEGTRTVVTSHGFSDQYARRMQVLIDGRSVYKPSTGGAEWQDLPIVLDDIERIEVIRGPNAASYGANAMVGVINIITRHPAEQVGSRVATVVGERGYRQTHVRHAGSHGGLHYRIGAELTDSEGYQDLRDNGLEPNDGTTTRKLDMRLDYRPGVNDYLTLHLGGSGGDRGAGTENDPVDVPRSREMASHYQYARWKRIIDTESELQLKLSHDYHRVRDSFNTGMLSEILGLEPALVEPVLGIEDQPLALDLGLQAERSNLEFSHRFRLLETVQTVWGIELREDKVTAQSYFGGGDSYTMRSRNLFFNTEWRPAPEWIVNLGNMTEHNNLIGTRHSPRLAVNRLFDEGYYLRAATARSWRIPAYLEEKAQYDYSLVDGTTLHTLFSSEGDLQPEQMDSVELAVGAEQRDMGYELRLFRNRIRDVISATVIVGDPWSAVFQNAGEADIEGGEFQLRIRANEQAQLHLSYAYARATGWWPRRIDQNDPTRDRHADVEENVPNSSIGMLLTIDTVRRGEIGIGYYYVAPMTYLGRRVRTEGISTFDVSYRQPFRLGSSDGQWRVLLRDMGGEYYTLEDNVWRDRQAFVSVAVNF